MRINTCNLHIYQTIEVRITVRVFLQTLIHEWKLITENEQLTFVIRFVSISIYKYTTVNVDFLNLSCDNLKYVNFLTDLYYKRNTPSVVETSAKDDFKDFKKSPVTAEQEQ